MQRLTQYLLGDFDALNEARLGVFNLREAGNFVFELLKEFRALTFFFSCVPSWVALQSTC